MTKFLKYLIVVFIAVATGCTKDAEIPLPAFQPSFVIHSYISPNDSGVIVFVHLSTPANTPNQTHFVYNAVVKISDGTNTATLNVKFPPPTSPGGPFYFIDSTTFKIVAGKTYNLTVSTPDGKLATASTMVPAIVSIGTFSQKRVPSQFGDSVYKMNFTFQDPAGEDNYYQFCAYVLNIDTTTGQIQNQSYTEDLHNYFASDGKVISDYLEVYGSSFLNPEEIQLIDFRLLQVNREYYLYHQSIYNSGGGPFSEPSIAFTNITGGVGVFAAFNYDQQVFRP